MKSENKIYSFYFSFRNNNRVPTSIVRFFAIYTVLAFVLGLGIDVLASIIMVVFFPVLFFLFKEHLIIDITNQKYRYAVDFCGFNFGTWKTLPAIEYVSVFVAKYRSGSQGGDDSRVLRKLEVNLIYERNKKLNVWVGMDENDAFEAGMFLAQNLNIRLLDATKRPFEWVDEE